jgi:hypothetical protein
MIILNNQDTKILESLPLVTAHDWREDPQNIKQRTVELIKIYIDRITNETRDISDTMRPCGSEWNARSSFLTLGPSSRIAFRELTLGIRSVHWAHSESRVYFLGLFGRIYSSKYVETHLNFKHLSLWYYFPSLLLGLYLWLSFLLTSLHNFIMVSYYWL